VPSEQPADFAPIRPTRASSDVIAQIRRAIMNGQYRPGDRLPTEREMAQQFGVSRVTVRDALRALEANGLVRIKVGGQGGPYVSAPDIALLSDSIGTHLHLRGTTFQDLAEARLALETTAARLAAQRATPEDLTALEAAIQGPMRPPTAGDTAASSMDFHTALVIASHNQALLAMFRATRALIQEAFDQLHAQQPDMTDAARKTHSELYAAIAEHDSERAGALMRQHLEAFASRAERFYATADGTQTATGVHS
jgi:GntR family transcriptional regulator, transcriptional repressor for pyruvate dehydrogenase complex